MIWSIGEEDEMPDDKSVTVIDIVDAFRLNEINLDKKAFMAYVKGYLKKIKDHLEANGKADRVATFQKGATDLVKFIISKFDEIQIFSGESIDYDAGFAYCYYKEQTDAGPTFLFFQDGMKEEKYWTRQRRDSNEEAAT